MKEKKSAAQKLGVIDLGTNTFHLLIASFDTNNNLVEEDRKRIFVHLAEEGIDTIGEAPFQRGVDAIQQFSEILKTHQIEKVRAFGTAGLRTASNGQLFIEQIKKLNNIDIELISGDEEARLIYVGVRKALNLDNMPTLIMDIGGGSVEFIFTNNNGIEWAQSFPIGISVLQRKFHHNDPITANEIAAIENHLEKTLAPLVAFAKKYPIQNLAGASGSFEVIESILPITSLSSIHSKIDVDHFFPMYQTYLKTTLSERLAMDHLPETRAKMIITAYVLMNFIITRLGIEQIHISAYAMKEGMLVELENSKF